MRTIKTIGAIGAMTAILLSSTVAFAEGKGPNMQNRRNGNNEGPSMMSSSTAERIRAEVEKEHGKVLKRLADIKDKEKQQRATRLADQFPNLNKTWTDHFSKELDQLAAVLKKIQDRVSSATTAGKDVSSTTVAIQAAQTAITNARSAVASQAAKTYLLASSTIPSTATTTSDGQERIMQALRKSFKGLHTGLFKDLFALRDGPMKDARNAVYRAARTLGKPIMGERGEKHATSTTSN